MENQKVLELAFFKLQGKAKESEFLKASEQFQKEFVEKQEGHISRKLVCSNEGIWCDVVTWKNEESAFAVGKAMNESETAKHYCSFMDPKTVEVKHLFVIQE